MVLLDDNFSTIVKAVKEGRRIFDNIKKFIKYVLTGNSGEIFTILLAPIIGLPIPLLPIHILWINLVTDGLPGLALTVEPAEKNVMQRPPADHTDNILSGTMGWQILFYGLLICISTLGIQQWAISEESENWQTMAFTVLCFSQLGYALSVRSETVPLFQLGLFSNQPLMASVGFTFILQLIIIYTPFFQQAFSVKPLSASELMICVIVSSITFHVAELQKIFRQRRQADLLSDQQRSG